MEILKKHLLTISLFALMVISLVVFFEPKGHSSETTITASSEQNIATTTINGVATSTTTGGNTTTSTTLKPCPSSSTDFFCYQDYYTKLVKQKGVDAAFVILKQEYDSNSYVRSQCHPITHVIGRTADLMYPSVAKAYEHGDAFCWSGYYHGVMETAAEKIGLDKIAGSLNNICEDIPGKATYSFDYYNCVHGLGHGVMDVTGDDLFKSLNLCDNLSGGWEKTSCYGGVFMENVIIDNQGQFTKYLKPTEPLYPCNAVDEAYKGSCYLMQTSYMLKVTHYNFSTVFGLCREADSGYMDTCFQSLGRDASGESLSVAEPTKAKCDLGANYEERSNCIIGAVKDFVSYWHSDVQAKAFCNILSADLQKICTDTAVSYYKIF